MNKIAVYTICKNEKKFIERWLNNVKDADYIVVLDTGSTDGTYEMLIEFQKIYPNLIIDKKIITPWRFDVARNKNLSMIPKDTTICVELDLDELISPSSWVDNLKNKWDPTKYNRADYRYVWSHLENGDPGSVYNFNKIHSLDWFWAAPVHEYLVRKESGYVYYKDECLSLLPSEFQIDHYPDNYKRRDYLGLIELRYKELEDLDSFIYLVREYTFFHRDQDCVDAIKNYLDKNTPQCNIYYSYLYYLKGKSEVLLGLYDEAINSLFRGINIFPEFRENYLELANIFIGKNQYYMGLGILQQAEKNSVRYDHWLETEEAWTYKLYDLLCLCYYYTGDYINSLQNATLALKINSTDDRLKQNVECVIDKIKKERSIN